MRQLIECGLVRPTGKYREKPGAGRMATGLEINPGFALVLGIEVQTEFFRTVARKNWLNFDGVTFSEDDTVLTLSTCCRKYDTAKTGNQRLVVMAKLLPEGATAQPYTVSLAENPEMP